MLNSTVDASTAHLKIQDFWLDMGKPLPVIIKKVSRLCCVSLARSTEPSGGEEPASSEKYIGAEDLRMGQNKVERDIRKVYATGGDVFASIKTKSKSRDNMGLADAFYAAYNAGNIGGKRGAQKLLAGSKSVMAGMPISKLDPTFHQAARNAKGRVPGQRSFAKYKQIVRNPDSIKTYVAKRIKMVGFAKGGWAAAARYLGGVRGLPSWVTRQKSHGSAVINNSPTKPTVTIANSVSYASDALPSSRFAGALVIAEGRLLKEIETAKQKAAEKAARRS